MAPSEPANDEAAPKPRKGKSAEASEGGKS